MRMYLVLIASAFFWCDVVTHRSTSTVPSADYAAQIRRHWVDATIPSYILSKNRRLIAHSSNSGYTNGASPIPGPPTVGKREIESPPFRYHQNPEENTTAKKVEPRIYQKHERLIAKKLKFASYRRSQSLNPPKPNISTESSQISQIMINDSIPVNNDDTNENKRYKNTQKYSKRKTPTIKELHGIDNLEPSDSVLGVIYSNNKKIIVKYDKQHTRVETFGPNIIKEVNSGQVNSSSSKKKKYSPQRYGDADHSDDRHKHENYSHDHEKHRQHGHRRRRPTNDANNSDYNRRPSTHRHRQRLPPNTNVADDYVTNLHGSFPPDYRPWQNFDNVDKLDTTHQSETDTENEHNGFDNDDKDEENEQNYFQNNHNQSISTENSETLWPENYGTDDNFQAEKDPLNFAPETSVHPDNDEDAQHGEHDDWNQDNEEENYASTEINFTQNQNQSEEQNNYEQDEQEEQAEDHKPPNSYPNENNYEISHDINNANGGYVQPGDDHDTDTDHNGENDDSDTFTQKPEPDSYHEGESDAVISNYPGELVSPANGGVAIQNTENQHYSSFEHDDRPNYSGDANDHDDGYPYENEDTLYSHEGHYSENVEDEYTSNYHSTNFENDNSQPPLSSTSYPSLSANLSHTSDQENHDYDHELQLESTKPSNNLPSTSTDSHYSNIPAPGVSRPEEVDPNVAPSSDEQQLHQENPSLASFTESQPAPTRPNSPPYHNNYPRPTYTPPYDYDDDDEENIDDYYEEDNTVPSASAYYTSSPPEAEDDTTASTYGYDEEPYDEDPYEETAPSADEYAGSYEDRQVRRSKRRLRSTLRKRRRHSISKYSKK